LFIDISTTEIARRLLDAGIARDPFSIYNNGDSKTAVLDAASQPARKKAASTHH